MIRKWVALSVTLTAVLLAAAGLSVADEDSPLHKVMEKVQASNAVVLKGVRNAAAYKKSQADVVIQARKAGDLLESARIHYNLGLLLMQKGDAQARTHLESAQRYASAVNWREGEALAVRALSTLPERPGA